MATDMDTGTNVSHLLSVVSYNCSGYNKSSTYLKEPVNCSKCDILCLQETWLLDGNMHKLADVNLDYSFTGVSGVDFGACVLQGRPYGGVAILWKNSLGGSTSIIKTGSNRLSAIKLSMSASFTLLIVFTCRVTIKELQ